LLESILIQFLLCLDFFSIKINPWNSSYGILYVGDANNQVS
jgi:hypothetical protein